MFKTLTDSLVESLFKPLIRDDGGITPPPTQPIVFLTEDDKVIRLEEDDKVFVTEGA
jgi:hypothetical protein